MGAFGARGAAAGAAFVLGAFGLATALPLATYTLALAAFGLPHVLSELRYVDYRFGPRFDAARKAIFVACLAGIVLGRLALAAEIVPAWAIVASELLLNAAMAASVLPLVGRRPAVAAFVFALLVLAWQLPFQTLALLAVAHNLTPVVFLAEATRGTARRRVLRLAALIFVALPALIASGWPQMLLARAGLFAPDLSAFDIGPLAQHLGAYLPAEAHGASWATAAFSAAVFAQLMHYAAVIGWLPRLIPTARPAGALLRWPRAGAFWAGVGAAAVAMLALFAADYTTARTVYGLAAAVHASIEIPLVAVVLASLRQPADGEADRQRRPVAQAG